MLTVKEFAHEMRVHPSTVRRWINKGWISAIKIGRTYRIDKSLLNPLKAIMKTDANIKNIKYIDDGF